MSGNLIPFLKSEINAAIVLLLLFPLLSFAGENSAGENSAGKNSAGEKLSGSPDINLPAHSLFGWAVSTEGGFSAVSAPGESYDNLTSAGAVYIYRMQDGKWKYFQRIIPSDPQMMKMFGQNLKLSGSSLLIGAPNDNFKAGSVYLFSFNGSRWEEKAKIVDPEELPFAGFGSAIDVGDGLALITTSRNGSSHNASGKGYIYNTSGTRWKLESIIRSPEEGRDDLFGAAVAVVSENQIIVTAPRAGSTVENCGAAYSYIKREGKWITNQVLLPVKAQMEGLFGSAISYSSGRVIIGAMQESTDSVCSGAAYIYSINGEGKWIPEKRFVPFEKGEQDYFGMSVFLNRGIAIIGSPKWEGDKLRRNGDMGCAYVYELSDTGWVSRGNVIPYDGDNDDHYGLSVSSYEDNLVIGSRLNDNSEFNNGSVYFYRISGLFPALSSKLIPERYELYQNYPNPFNAVTVIRYDLPSAAHISIEVYDILGRKTAVIKEGYQEAGRHQEYWNGRNEHGAVLSSGVYIYRLTTPAFTSSKKLVILK